MRSRGRGFFRGGEGYRTVHLYSSERSLTFSRQRKYYKTQCNCPGQHATNQPRPRIATGPALAACNHLTGPKNGPKRPASPGQLVRQSTNPGQNCRPCKPPANPARQWPRQPIKTASKRPRIDCPCNPMQPTNGPVMAANGPGKFVSAH